MAKKTKNEPKDEAKEAEKNTAKKESAGASILNDTLKALQAKFGEGSIMKLGDTPKVNINAIPTGSMGLDMALGVGGIPRGRIIEIFGPESSGKTTLSLHIVAEAQKLGGVCAYIDAEHAMDPDYTKKLGVNISELLISQPDTGEQALEIVESLVRTGKIDVIVIDSVAALTPKDEIEGDMGAYHVGKQARLMSQALRKLTAIVARSKTVVIFINQIRMQIGVMFGCFSYDTKIMLANGKKEKIGTIVNQTKKVKVLSYNFEKKCVEEKMITDWHINGETDSFLQFFIQNHTGNGRRGFSCTPDHKIYTPYGWKKAKELKEGDEVSVNITDTSLTAQQEEIIIGSLLGDGNIKMNNEQTAYFREEHGPKQKEYVSWLSKELGDITSNVNLNTSRDNAIVETKHLLRIGDLYGLFYPQNKKIVPEFLVEQITPRMIALWYCGDGTLQGGYSNWKEKNYKRTPRATLYANAFGDDPLNVDRIDRMFKKFNIKTSWRKCGVYKVLNFNVKESEKFFELISPFIPKVMEYKLPEKYKGRYHQTNANQSVQSQILRGMRIKSIQTRIPYQNGERISKQRFDISVADNHNYFVDGCLVSNSPETTPGGKALKFYTSVRLDIRRTAQIKKGEEVVGSRTKVKVVKNKVASPFKQTEFDIIYGEGISREGELIALGEKYKILDKSGSSYSYKPEVGEDMKLGRGYDATRTFLKENPKVADQIMKEIRKKFAEEA
ncbi:MAG: recombinase RecA [Candidatus Pacebacteria bacterium]|nr:recombinase RecA [Candidatus Paceibacterota bacterium]MCF7862628.1 recombinase RecA [Candidatus Paceibacterota bacterium]